MYQALTLEAGITVRSTARDDKALFDFLESIQVAINGHFNSKEADSEVEGSGTESLAEKFLVRVNNLIEPIQKAIKDEHGSDYGGR